MERRFYMSISFLDLSEEDAVKIKEAILAAAPAITNYSVNFDDPITADEVTPDPQGTTNAS